VQQALVILLCADRDADAAPHRADGETLRKQPLVVVLRIVDGDVEEVRM
jgi:hypothetical protein